MAKRMQFFKILVVDDFEPFRKIICSTLRQSTEFQVSEASDGLDAEKAEKLRPDVILLDIGLPNLNGIEAAKRLCQLNSPARILFRSQESSADILEEAFSTGAQGYICKLQAGAELLPAIEAVLAGKQFISSSLHNHKNGKPAPKAEALEYPWQRAVMDAFDSPGHLLLGKINIAERAIAKRLANPDQPDTEELTAVRRALRSLGILNAETKRQGKSDEKKEIA